MSGLEEEPVYCPCCGERITLLVDCSLSEQSYVEDCSVCCRPLVVTVTVDDDGDIALTLVPES